MSKQKEIQIDLATILPIFRLKMEEDKNLIAVQYPGRVENDENMIRSLGGLTNISKVVK